MHWLFAPLVLIPIHVYILIRQFIIYIYYTFYLMSLSSPIASLHCVLLSQTSANVGSVAKLVVWLFWAVFSDIRPNCTDYLISPISNFFIIITRTIFFYFNLHRDIRATDPSWTFIRRKKITSQEIKYDHNSFNRVGLYLENFLSLPICSK